MLYTELQVSHRFILVLVMYNYISLTCQRFLERKFRDFCKAMGTWPEEAFMRPDTLGNWEDGRQETERSGDWAATDVSKSVLNERSELSTIEKNIEGRFFLSKRRGCFLCCDDKK